MVGQRFRVEFCFRQGSQYWFSTLYCRVDVSIFGGDDSFEVCNQWDNKFRSTTGLLLGHSIHYVACFAQDIDNPAFSFLKQFDVVNSSGGNALPISCSLLFRYYAESDTRRPHLEYWAGLQDVYSINGVLSPSIRATINGQAWLAQPYVALFPIFARQCLWERPRPDLPLGRMTPLRQGKARYITTNNLRTRHDNDAVRLHFGY